MGKVANLLVEEYQFAQHEAGLQGFDDQDGAAAGLLATDEVELLQTIDRTGIRNIAAKRVPVDDGEVRQLEFVDFLCLQAFEDDLFDAEFLTKAKRKFEALESISRTQTVAHVTKGACGCGPQR